MNKQLLMRRYEVLGKSAPLFYEQPLELVRGEGVWVYDASGRRFLDTYNNVPHVGHCHPHVVSALTAQASTFNSHTRYLHENIVGYVERLTAKFADSLSMAMLTCTGSEANELALRMARQHTGAQGIIVTSCAYHGNTEAVAELGTAFMPEARTTQRVLAFPPPCSYRIPVGASADSLADFYAAEVAKAVATFSQRGLGVAGILICPEFANEGLVMEPPGFVEKAVDCVRAAGGLYIADEVQGGFGRTGEHWWSHQYAGVIPDIVTLGKPMGNGHPLAGVVARADLIEEFGAWGMYFNTFAGNPVSCAVGNAVLDVLEQEDLLSNAVTVGRYIAERLNVLQAKYPIIGDVRHKGLFFGVELVSDQDSRQPASVSAMRVVNAMCRKGVLISRIGLHDNVLKMRPPMSFTHEHADILLETFDHCLAEL